MSAQLSHCVAVYSPADSASVRTDQQALYNIYTLSRRAGTTVVEMGSKNRIIYLKYRDNMVDMDMYILRVRYRYFEQTVMLVPSSGKRKSIGLVSVCRLSVCLSVLRTFVGSSTGG